MSTTLLVVQTLNGLQLGVLLFLIAAGLTLVFGVMDFINLAHGVQYMLGAYLAVAFYALTGSFLAALVLALASLVLLTLMRPLWAWISCLAMARPNPLLTPLVCARARSPRQKRSKM